MQDRIVELQMDVPAIWQVWDERCRQLFLVEGTIAKLKNDISQDVADLYSGAGDSPVVDYSILLDRGTSIILRNLIACARLNQLRNGSSV